MYTATGDRLIGRVLEGRYEVLAKLARGGMSTVYAAHDRRLDRHVAVKVMSANLSDDRAFADRFAREAQVAARLSHPNVVAVFDQGTDSGHVFLVMELVRGRTLRDLITERGALGPELAVSIMQPVLAALAAAHRAGLVHRDIKPENILLADDGAVKVADFGLAKAVESDLSSTRTGLMMGTVAYCSPEQFSRGTSDARSDVYSAGVVLYELLTGRPPFAGDNPMAVAYQHVHSEVPPPSVARPELPWALDQLVRRATCREPSGRPLDAGALLAELHDVRADLGLPVVAVPPRLRAPNTQATQRMAPVAQPTRAFAGAGQPTFGGPHPTQAMTAPNHPGMRPPFDTVVADPVQWPAPGTGPDDPRTPKQIRRAERRRRRRRTAVIVVIVLLLGAAVGYGSWWYARGRWHRVPDVVGQSQQAAVASLRAGGLTVDAAMVQQYSETVARGAVIASRPGTGSHVLSGRRVTLVISRGPQRFTLPDVGGRSVAAAVAALGAAAPNVQVVQVPTASTSVKSGLVVGTQPTAGTAIKPTDVVRLQVSTGPPLVTVPDVRAKSQADATSALQSAGFRVAATQAYSDTVDQGAVISESPSQGSAYQQTNTVQITVSKGPELVPVPDVSSTSDPDTAAQILRDAGFTVQVDKKGKSFWDFSSYKVKGTSPGAGEMVRPGSTVTLTVG